MLRQLIIVYASLAMTHAFDHWGYQSGLTADRWAEVYETCGGKSQSPIDIPMYGAVVADIPPFKFSGYDSTNNISMKIYNNGFSVKMVFISSGEITLLGGGLNTRYKVLELHWHWGSSNNFGSEHLLQGKAFPMELHIVHYKANLRVSEAVKAKESLAVLGFFFEEAAEDNPNYDSIVDHLSKINYAHSITPIPAIRLDSLIPSSDHLEHFYRYSGSLTTPGCHESVVWTVFPKTIPLSRSQLNAFRNLKSAEYYLIGKQLPLVNNFRPPQPLNDRKVEVSLAKECKGL